MLNFINIYYQNMIYKTKQYYNYRICLFIDFNLFTFLLIIV